MKLSCALVLTLANLVIATPFGFSVKGSGSSSKVDPTSGTFGTFGLVQSVPSKAEYSGTFSKYSSGSFASNSASESSGSFSYNAAHGTPASGLHNTGAGFGASGQVVGQNAGVTPQAFTTAVPFSHNTASGGSSFHSSEANANTASDTSLGQQPGSYLGFTSPVSGSSQGNNKPSSFVSGSPAYAAASGSFSSKDIYSAQHASQLHNSDATLQFQHQQVATEQKPGSHLGSNVQTSVSQDISKPFVSSFSSKEQEKFKESTAINGFPSSISNSGSVNTVPTTQAQSSPTVEKKPVYSSGFGGPPGVLSPYDKTSVSGVHIQSSNSYPYQQHAQISESVNSKPQDVYYSSLNNPKPSYASQQQSVAVKPSGTNYFTSNTESSYKPEAKPTHQNEKQPCSVDTNERPTSELKPFKDVQTADKYSYQKPEVVSPQKPGVSVEYSSQTIKPGYQVSVQAYPAQETGKDESTKKPLYTGGFGAPAGVLKPNEYSFSNNFASTPVKPEKYEESKPTVGYTPTVTKVNEYSSSSEVVNPTEKPYRENTNYQSFNVGSSPASYATTKPSGSINYSEQNSATSSFSVSGTAGKVVATEQKGEQILSKPYNDIPVNPTYSSWEQNPTQASTSFVLKPETAQPVKPSVQIPSQSKPTFSNAPETFTTSQPPSYSHSFEGKNPASSIPGGYGPNTVSVKVEETKPNYQLLSTNQYESSQYGAVANQAEEKKPSYQPYPTSSSYVSSGVASSYKPGQTSVPFDKTRPSGTVVTSHKEAATISDDDVEVSSHFSEKNNEKEITPPTFGTVKPTVPQNSALHSNAATGFVSVSQQPPIAYVEQKEAQKPNTQYPNKPTVTDQSKPLYSSSFGTLTGSTGYKPSSYGQESTFAAGSNDKVSQNYYGTTVKPFVKPDLSSGSQQTSVSTGFVSQNSNVQKHTESTFAQNKPSVVTSEQQKFTNQAFTSNSAVANGATGFGSKPQYQLPTVQPSVPKNTWHSNSFGTAKPYYNTYPGFTSSFTTYGQESSQDKNKQTYQVTSTGQYNQYNQFSSGQYKPYTTGQYKPHWGHQSYQKFSNVYPTGGSFVSTYAPTTFKPFVTSSPFDKSKTSTSFSATANKESTFASGFGSPLSVTTTKPSSLTQTSYKPVPESTGSAGYSEKPKVNNVVGSTFETPLSKPSETHPQKPSQFTQSSGSIVTSSFGQSSFGTVKPTVNFSTPSSQFAHSRPSAQSPSEVVNFNTNNESGLTAEVTNVAATASTLASEVNPSIQDKPYPGVYEGSFAAKPFSPSTSQNNADEKIQTSVTSKPYWSSNSNQKESSVDVGVTPSGLKPTEQPFFGTTLYYINKEVTPTQVSPVKPSSQGTFTVETVSPNKDNEKNKYTQTPKPEWSANYHQKEPSLFASVGGASESLKPTGQPILGTSSYSFNKEITPTQGSAIKPSVHDTGLTTGTTNVGSVQSVLSNTNKDSSAVHVSSVEKWSSTTTPEITHKPEYSTSFEHSYNHNLSPSVKPESDSATVSGSEQNSKPLSATGSPQFISYETHGKPVFPKPTAQVSVVEKKPAFVVSYKEKDTNQASVGKPTVSTEYGTDVKVTSKYTDGPAKVPTSFIQSTQVPYNPTNTQTSQQTLGFNSNSVASQSTQASYVGGFGGPAGILKPNDFGSYSQQQYVQSQYKPSYNNQVPLVNQQNSPSGVSSNAASYKGFGAPSGVLTASENVKPSGFGYVQNANKYPADVQSQKDVTQHAVFESQASAGGQSNAVVNPNTHGFVSNQHHIQNPFNGGVSTGTGFANNNYEVTGQFSGTKPFSTAQSSAGISPGFLFGVTTSKFLLGLPAKMYLTGNNINN